MKTLYAAVPLVTSPAEECLLIWGNTLPVEFIASAGQTKPSGSEDWQYVSPRDDVTTLAAYADQLGSLAPDRIMLLANAFQWPAAFRLARALGPRAVTAELPAQRDFGDLTSFPATWSAQAVSLGPTNGFPAEWQPHPSNLPVTASRQIDCSEDFIARISEIVSRLDRPVLATRQPPCGWTREGIGILGEIVLGALLRHDRSVLLHLGATPTELLTPGVLPSLGLLEIERLDVLAAAGPDSDGALLACCMEIAKAGLADVSRLIGVLGGPQETVKTAMQTLQSHVRTAISTGVPRVRFEWWYNVAGSALYRQSDHWEDFVRDGSRAWYVDGALWHLVPSELTEDHRTAIREAIGFTRMLYKDLEIEGPELVAFTTTASGVGQGPTARQAKIYAA